MTAPFRPDEPFDVGAFLAADTAGHARQPRQRPAEEPFDVGAFMATEPATAGQRPAPSPPERGGVLTSLTAYPRSIARGAGKVVAMVARTLLPEALEERIGLPRFPDTPRRHEPGAIAPTDLPPAQRRGPAGYGLPGLVQLPWSGPAGEKAAFDVARWTPLSGLTDAAPPGAPQSITFDRWPKLLTPSGPFVDIGAAVANRDAYTGRPIITRSMTPGDAAGAMAEKAGDILLPSVLGFQRRRLMDDIRAGNWAAARVNALGLIGLRPRVVRPGEDLERAQWELADALEDARRDARQALRRSQRPERDTEILDQYDRRVERAQRRYQRRTAP